MAQNGSAEPILRNWQDEYDRPLLKWSVSRSHALFMVTPDLKLLDLNLAGEALSKADSEIQIAGGHFAFSDKGRTASLRTFLATGGLGTAGWSYRRACGSIGIIHVEWLPPALGDPGGLPIALTFQPSDLAERYVWADFAPHFDITRSEAAIVKRLIGGQTPFAVAEALNLSIETVRTHIRRVYHKLGISSREELFAMIASYRIG
ncbi:helix-turn-helix transcriptional regulator [Brevundimonas abyssalis]|uniref:helix-turn-helix transcriptional regulator n=2 Tax=Caulobacteraceae TaxID=76892 RepID=UPI0011D1B5A3|nr:helix-turn-helix transcriptional regulator [Brevundimonas abyssalis]